MLQSTELAITSAENGGLSYFDGTVSFSQSNCFINGFGYNVCLETATFNGPALFAGTYWVNLQNATVPSGDPVYWDENSGKGCGGSDGKGANCPSLASQNSVGTIPSEAFTIEGTGAGGDDFEPKGVVRSDQPQVFRPVNPNVGPTARSNIH